jgi:hypothetical protein
MDRLEAVTRMVRTINHGRPSALDTDGASPVAFAEDILEEVTHDKLVEGRAENVTYARMFTLTAAGKLTTSDTLPVGTLKVTAAGPDAHRTLALRGTSVYDVSPNKNTDVLGTAGAQVCVDHTFEIDFDDISPQSQIDIVAEATRIFQRRFRSSPEQDTMLTTEAVAAEVKTDKAKPPAARPTDSTRFPALSGLGQGGREQGQ